LLRRLELQLVRRHLPVVLAGLRPAPGVPPRPRFSKLSGRAAWRLDRFWHSSLSWGVGTCHYWYCTIVTESAF
jgi:hypothetical protein